MLTFDAVVHNKKNNLDFIRLVAALAVLVSHAYSLSGHDPQEPFMLLTGFIRVGTFSVFLFFIISGFLITKSWDEHPKLFPFLVKRFLRIMPGLIVTVLFCIYIVGLATTTLPKQLYLHHQFTYDYFRNLLFYDKMRFGLPGVFEKNPYPSMVNGSLWTLPIEVFMYGTVAALGLIKKQLALLVLALLLISEVYITHTKYTFSFDLFNMHTLDVFQLGVFFYMGSVYYIFRSNLPFNSKLFWVLLVIWIVSFHTHLAQYLIYFTLPYLALYLGFIHPTTWIANFSRYGDYSYGIYIFASPIQQSIVYYYYPHVSVARVIILSLLGTAILAFLSWHFIEKPALKMKRWFLPSRPVTAMETK